MGTSTERYQRKKKLTKEQQERNRKAIQKLDELNLNRKK